MNKGLRIGKFLETFGYSLSARWPRVVVTKQRHKRKLFKDQELIWDVGGFWRLKSMPSEEDLHLYYSEEYWNHRGDQSDSINARDISHYLQLARTCPELFTGSHSTPRRVLNFGSGHGGLSHLLWGLNFEIYNIDPSIFDFKYPERWKSFPSIHDLKKAMQGINFDLIYASHALEHVPDIEDTLNDFQGLSDKSTIFMFEVPDSSSPGQGGMDGNINAPHTYYYTFGFFLKKFRNIKQLQSINSNLMFELGGNTPGAELEEGKGDSIRFIGQGLVR